MAGVRAFTPLALAALFAALGLFALPLPYVVVGGDGWWWSVFGVLAGLAVVEVALDKLAVLEGGFNYAMVPVRVFAGAMLFTAALGFGLDAGSLPWLAAGGVIAALVAVLKVVLRPSAKTGVSPAFLSFFEDVVALVGGALGYFVPLVPLVLVAFLLYFYYRVRRRRGRKYGGLRILGD